MNLPITSYIYSVDDKASLLEKLAKIEKAIFTTKKSFEEYVNEEFAFSVSQSLLLSAKEANVSFDSPESITQFLTRQQEAVRALPVVGIRVALPLSFDTVRSISKWFDINLEKKILVDVKIDPSLLGGAAIEWNGKYMDYSLKKILHEKFKSRVPAEKPLSIE